MCMGVLKGEKRGACVYERSDRSGETCRETGDTSC